MPITEEESASGALAIAPTDAPPHPDVAEALKKKVYIGFSGTIALSLALAGLYIGGRVFAARGSSIAPEVQVTATAKVTTIAKVTPATPAPPRALVAHDKPSPLMPSGAAPQQVATISPLTAAASPANQNTDPVATAAPAPSSALVPLRTLVRPQPNEIYLQLAALGPKGLDRYLPQVEAQGLHPLVAPGPDATIFRVLIGPYPNRDDMRKSRKELESKGVESMPRAY